MYIFFVEALFLFRLFSKLKSFDVSSECCLILLWALGVYQSCSVLLRSCYVSRFVEFYGMCFGEVFPICPTRGRRTLSYCFLL